MLRFFAFLFILVLCVWSGARLSVRFRAGSDGWVHVLLLGVDDEDTTSRTDAMMLASCNADGRVKLISLQRDTMVSMGTHGNHKLNAAYKLGGCDLIKSCVRSLWGIEVDHIAIVDYASFLTLVDAAGGVDIDITREEALEINRNMRSRRAHLKDYSPLAEMTVYGEGIHLTGEQALGYCRIRHIDSDYVRTSRQRNVLSALVRSLKSNPQRLLPFAMEALATLETDMPPYVAASLGICAITGGDIRQYRLPADGTFDSGMVDGVWSIRPYAEDNLDMMRRILAE